MSLTARQNRNFSLAIRVFTCVFVLLHQSLASQRLTFLSWWRCMSSTAHFQIMFFWGRDIGNDAHPLGSVESPLFLFFSRRCMSLTARKHCHATFATIIFATVLGFAKANCFFVMTVHVIGSPCPNRVFQIHIFFRQGWSAPVTRAHVLGSADNGM